jgi:hypothetical protein
MAKLQDPVSKPSSQSPAKDLSTSVDESEAGLTDDQRVSREGESVGDGARVKPGPADEQRTQ